MKKLIFTLLISYNLVSCDESILISHDNEVISNDNQENDHNSYCNLNSIFLSKEDAVDVATKFWTDSNTATRSSIENTDYDINILCSDGVPQMYVINYKNGGFVIVSATKAFYPILAYSEDGTFPVRQEEVGLRIWLEETKRAISDYAQVQDSIKDAFRMMWSQYENNNSFFIDSRTRSNMPSGEIACLERIEYYYRINSGSGGWNFAPLSQAESAFSSLGLEKYYESLCFRAQANNSALNETVIGWRIVRTGDGVFGPYIQTAWHQHAPFSDNLGFNAGCGTIAVSQLMNYYKYPETFTIDNMSYNWNNIPNYPSSSSDQAALVEYVYKAIDSNHISGTNTTYTTPGNLISGMQKMGYSVSKQSHDYRRVISDLKSGKPVIMLGNETNMPEIGNIAYFGNSHYWICDGVNDVTYYIEYFAEWQPYGNGSFETGWYSYESPNSIPSNYVNRSFHMNWGWNENGSNHYNGWFIGDTANSGNGDFHYNREDFFISVVS